MREDPQQTHVIKSFQFDIMNALQANQLVKHDIQQENATSKWIPCPKLQIRGTFAESHYWLYMLQFQNEQYESADGKKYFSFQKENLSCLCEVKPSFNEVVVMHTSKDFGPRFIVHDPDAKKFLSYNFQHKNQQWRVYNISEDSTVIETKEPEPVKIPKGIC